MVVVGSETPRVWSDQELDAAIALVDVAALATALAEMRAVARLDHAPAA